MTLTCNQLKKIDIGHNFLKIRYQCFHIANCHFLWQDLSTGIQKFVLVILAFVGIGHYGGHCVSQTHLVSLVDIFFILFLYVLYDFINVEKSCHVSNISALNCCTVSSNIYISLYRNNLCYNSCMKFCKVKYKS